MAALTWTVELHFKFNGKLEIELRHAAKASTHASGFDMLKYSGPPLKVRMAEVEVADLMREERKLARRARKMALTLGIVMPK